ncbi:MAG: ferritin [Burkholderiales bacterium]|nr:ferritin [Burkholderiales bacterium]
MTRTLGWLQRALRHEFAAARQFALQASIARRLGDPKLAAQCDEGAREELRHAGLLADAILAAGAMPADGALAVLPTGRTRDELLDEACRTESAAVLLYRDALRATPSRSASRDLFEFLQREEAEHLALLQRMRRIAA